MKNPSILPSSLNPAYRSEREAVVSPLVTNTLLICAAVLMGVALLLYPLVGNAVARENGPLEVLQFLLLTWGFVLLGWKAIRRSEVRAGLLPIALLFLTLALRELDLRQSAAPDWLVQITLHQRHLWLTPVWVVVLGFAFLRRAEIKSWIAHLDLPTLKALGITAVVLYAGSFGFEKHLFAPKGAFATFGEETFELLLTMCLLTFAGAVSLRPQIKPAQDYRVVRSFN